MSHMVWRHVRGWHGGGVYMGPSATTTDYIAFFRNVKHNLFARYADDSNRVEGCPCLRRRAYMGAIAAQHRRCNGGN